MSFLHWWGWAGAGKPGASPAVLRYCFGGEGKRADASSRAGPAGLRVERAAVGRRLGAQAEPQRQADAGGAGQLDLEPGAAHARLGRRHLWPAVPVVVQVADPGRIVADGVPRRSDRVLGERAGL